MVDLSLYRSPLGRIDINQAENDGKVEIERNPQQAIAGAREKHWCYSDQGDFLFKKTLTGNNEDFGELLGYEFARLFNLPCAEYDLATFNGENGVITGDIVGEDEELIGGDEILKTVNSIHILPIQRLCIEYDKLKQNKKSKKYLTNLIKLYCSSIIRTKDIDKLLHGYQNNKDISLDLIQITLEEFFEELSNLYEYSFYGYNSRTMTEEERKTKEEMENYFQSRGFDINGWNKYKKVVVSNNLYDIWSLIDNYCNIKGYHIKKDNNIMLDLIRMFIYDTILNQGDRHISNWSILLNKRKGEMRFAPIYDNSKICILDSSKEVLRQKAQAIISFEKNKGNMPPSKLERALLNIERNINNGIESKLMVDYSDNYSKNNRFEMIEKLLYSSSEEVSEIIEEAIDSFNQENVMHIFEKLEEKLGIQIPQEIKVVVSKTIELNIDKIRLIMEEYKERRNQR